MKCIINKPFTRKTIIPYLIQCEAWIYNERQEKEKTKVIKIISACHKKIDY